VAQLSSAVIAVMVVTPLGVPRHVSTGTGTSLRMQATNWILPAVALELVDTPPLLRLPARPVAPAIQPQRAAVVAAAIVQQDVLIASRIGGRCGP